MFDEKYIDALPNNPLDAGRALCSDFLHYHRERLEYQQELSAPVYDNYLAAFGAAQALSESNGLVLSVVEVTKDRGDSIRRIVAYIESLQGKLDLEFASLTVEKSKDLLKNKFGKIFHYEFSEGDLERGQALLNEIRDLITQSSVFEESHKQRLFARLERVQSELHKKMSDLDRFWGLIGDAGVALGKFGNDAKPIVDRIRELTSLVWATQARAEGLPSNCPSLLHYRPILPKSCQLPLAANLPASMFDSTRDL